MMQVVRFGERVREAMGSDTWLTNLAKGWLTGDLDGSACLL